MPSQPTWGYCSVCKGNAKIAARGMCWKHYARWRRRNGDVSDPDFINKGKVCKIDDCQDEAKAEGYCIKHHRRVEKYADPTIVHTPSDSFVPMTYDKLQCVMSGCKEEKNSKELCCKHYHNYMYHKRTGLVNTVFDYLRLREDNP